MTRKNQIILLVTTMLCGALALTAVRAHDAPQVATGFVAHTLCSETFVSGLDPARVLPESTAAMPGTALITWAMNYKVDRARKDVTVTLLAIYSLDNPYASGVGRLQPVAMERSLVLIDDVRSAVGDSEPPPCDSKGREV